MNRASLEQSVAQTIAARRLLAEGERVVVALSGGADSVATLLVLQALGYAVEGAHCNFCLRGQAADADEAFVRALCERRGIGLQVRRFDTQAYAAAQGWSIEMAARALRYEWFATFGCAVATGHHREDNAETVLLNLTRGTGLAGLAGMRHRNGYIVRPLLDNGRAEIETYLAERGEPFCTDATNADVRFRRNRMRHEVLPLLAEMNPQIVQTLHATAQRLRETDIIFRQGLKALRREMTEALTDGFRIEMARLAAHPAAPTLLHEWLSPLGFVEPQQWLTAREGALGEGVGWLVARAGGWLEVRRMPAPDLRLESLQMTMLERAEMDAIPRDRAVACLDAAKIVGRLSLRLPETGDRFQPFGMRGTKLVSDYLTDRHYSRIDKLAVRLLCDEAGILWMVGERIAQRAAVTPETQQILLIQTSDNTRKETDD